MVPVCGTRAIEFQSTACFETGPGIVDAGNIDKARLVPDWVALGLAPAMDKSGRDARPGKQKKAAGRKPATDGKPTNKPTAGKPSSAE